MLRYIVFAAVLFLSFSFLPVDKECKDFHLKHSFSIGQPFEYSMQSNDLFLQYGKPSEVDILVFSGYEYNLSASFDLDNSKGRMLVVDEMNNQVLYDSKNDPKNKTAKQFIVKQTKTLKVILSTGSSRPTKEEGELICAGLLVEYLQLPKLDFNTNN